MFSIIEQTFIISFILFAHNQILICLQSNSSYIININSIKQYTFVFLYHILPQSNQMFFGFNPFTMFNEPPVRRNLNQNNQGQENIFNQFGNFMNDMFMHPQPAHRQQQQQQNRNQNQNNQQRPRYYKPKKNQQKKEQPQQQIIYNQNTGQYWKNKGNQAFKKGDYEGALKLYDRAIELNNTQSVFFSNRAKVMRKLNRLQQALQDAQTSVQLDVQNIKGHLMCGQVLAQIGKRKKDIKKVQSSLIRLTKAFTLCANQNKQQFEKEVTIYIYRVKKLLWYMKFNEIREQRIKTINQYKKYLQTDKDVPEQEKEKKLELFMDSINENVVFQIPSYLICNITLDLMQEPATTESGQTYEKTAIQQHIQRNGKTDPFTRKPISGILYPSISIKKAIEDFLQKNPWAYEYSEGETMDDIQF